MGGRVAVVREPGRGGRSPSRRVGGASGDVGGDGGATPPPDGNSGGGPGGREDGSPRRGESCSAQGLVRGLVCDEGSERGTNQLQRRQCWCPGHHTYNCYFRCSVGGEPLVNLCLTLSSWDKRWTHVAARLESTSSLGSRGVVRADTGGALVQKICVTQRSIVVAGSLGSLES